MKPGAAPRAVFDAGPIRGAEPADKQYAKVQQHDECVFVAVFKLPA